MDLSEITIQSFVIKIWLEEPPDQGGRASWRGHITHIPSKRRVYLDKLAKIIHFMIPYLEQMGIEVDDEWA